MEFVFRVTKDSGMDFGERGRAYFKQYLDSHAGQLLKITEVLPESDKQRRYFEGAIVPLLTYYQEGLDHHSDEDRREVREWLKLEFNGGFLSIGGKQHRFAKSTRGREVLNAFLERVVEWLIENYAPPAEALEPASFKQWRDTVMDGPDNYIDWLIQQRLLK